MVQSMNNSVQGGNLNVANTVGAAERDGVRLDVRDDAGVGGKVSRDAGLGDDAGGSGGAEADISRESATDSDGGDRGGVDRLGDDNSLSRLGGLLDVVLGSPVTDPLHRVAGHGLGVGVAFKLEVDSCAGALTVGVVEAENLGTVLTAVLVGEGDEDALVDTVLLVEVVGSGQRSEVASPVLAVVVVEALALALERRVAVAVVGRQDRDSASDAVVDISVLVHGSCRDSRVGGSGASQSSSDDSRGAENSGELHVG